MKNIYLLTLLLGLLSNSIFAQYEFKGQLDKSYTLSEVYLYKYVGSKAYPFDTIEVKKNKFNKSYKTFDKGLYILGIGDVREDIVLVEDNINFVVPAVIENIPWKAYSLANADYANIRTAFQTYDNNLAALDKEYSSFAKLQQTDPEQFNQRVMGLRSSLNSSNQTFDAFMAKLAKEGKSDYGKKIGGFLSFTSTTTNANYFNKDNFNLDILDRGDFIQRKLNYYFMRFGRMSTENIAYESQRLLGFATQKNLSRELMFEAVVNNAILVDQNQTRALVMQHEMEFGKTQIADRMQRLLPVPAPTIGQVVPEIEAIDKDGNSFKLSDLRGQVVLIDFWASWCGPCRRESPNVVANYEKYKDQGFTVLSISADRKREPWLQAIVHDKYTWNNHLLASENGYKATKDFKVSGYPTMFLIDKEGKLIATGSGLRGAGLGTNLARVFGQ